MRALSSVFSWLVSMSIGLKVMFPACCCKASLRQLECIRVPICEGFGTIVRVLTKTMGTLATYRTTKP